MSQSRREQPIRSFQKVCDILESYDYEESKIIPILQKVQKEYKYLPEEVMNYIATSLGVTPARVFGVASFYSHFALEPKGKYIIKVCDGTACHVKGSRDLYNTLKDLLSLGEDESTTQDMLFTVETVSCLGACGLAPVMTVNEEVYGKVDSEKAAQIIESYKEREQQDEQK